MSLSQNLEYSLIWPVTIDREKYSSSPLTSPKKIEMFEKFLNSLHCNELNFDNKYSKIFAKYGIDNFFSHNSFDDSPQSFCELKKLITRGSFTLAIKHVDFLLAKAKETIVNSTYNFITETYVNLWLLKINLLLKLGLFNLIENQIKSLKDDFNGPLFDYESSRVCYPEKNGSLLPFNIRLINAVLPSYLDKHLESLDQLALLCEAIDQILSPDLDDEARKVWLMRKLTVLSQCLHVNNSCSNYFAMEQTCFIILDHLEKCHSILPNDFITKEYRNIIGKLGRMGKIVHSQKIFEKYLSLFEPDSASYQFQYRNCQAFLAIANADYPKAVLLLEEAIKIDPTNFQVMNNLAVCYLYVGQLESSLNLFKSFLCKNETIVETKCEKIFCGLNDVSVFNLMVIYELESDNSLPKKLAIFQEITKNSNEFISIQSFKLE